MTIEERRVRDVVVLSISGDIATNGDGVTQVADKVRSLLQDGQARLVLDLGRVRYVDSAGLGELVHAFTAVRNRGGAMKLLNVTKRVSELLVVTKLATVFECFDSEAEALASFMSPSAAGAASKWASDR
ncbi:MAG: anti-anti-sigma factor [Acidobacteria bacterium]|nr:anti-anti-sigma factor [Acidobacteriota bacterium]